MNQEIESLSRKLHALSLGRRVHQIPGAPEMPTHQRETVRERRLALVVPGALLQKSKSAMFDGGNPLKYEGTILDKNVKNQFLQQNPWEEGIAGEPRPHVSPPRIKRSQLECPLRNGASHLAARPHEWRPLTRSGKLSFMLVLRTDCAILRPKNLPLT
jgi:hypothetical protein